METPYDFILGKVRLVDGQDGTQAIYVLRLDFVCWGISSVRALDLKRQWESSDKHYDYVVCEGTPDELLLFAREADFEKFQFFTFLTPTTVSYRMVSEQDRKNYGIKTRQKK